MYTLDEKDMRILAEVDKDCRQELQAIADRTDLSRDQVRYRINRLEEAHIQNYLSIIDFTKLGYKIIRLYVTFQNTTHTLEQDIIDHLQQRSHVTHIYELDGRYDLAIGHIVEDIFQYQEQYESLMDKYRQYIADTNTSIFTDFIEYHRNYLNDDTDATAISTGSFTPYDHDETDLQILRHISRDARATYTEIGNALNIAPTTANYRLQQLEQENVIVAYRALLDYRKLGYEYYKIDLHVEDYTILSKLNAFARKHPNVVYQDVTVGGRDFEFDCELPTQDAFYNLMDELKELLGGKLRSYFYHKVINIHKHTYFPDALLS